ncbi:hypothetical protein ACFO0M_27825 [Micromonospora mangrovi]|uniref:FXSXX-COOH protein n=2 Tax=Micromonospora TaxID=1873 RepID=A0AAU7ME24_9ACTN
MRVVERAAGLRAARAGIVLHPNALASLGRLREESSQSMAVGPSITSSTKSVT